MISTKLYGRLGNQLFQIAAAIGTAKKNHTIYKIPRRSVNMAVWNTYINHLPEFLPEDNVDREHKENGHFPYQEIPYKKGESLMLDGYFQTEKYFEQHRSEVLRAFGFEYEMLHGAVSIHVRRGDYLKYPTKHPLCTMQYYKKAVQYFYDKGHVLFIVYSDDLDWCRENFTEKEFGQEIKFLFSTSKDEMKDLESMSCCEHNIIANSSFSWWAAWLNRNKDKVVIAPEVWFCPDNSHLDTRDLVPESWVRM